MRNLSAIAALIFILLSSCVSDKQEGPFISDATLLSLAQNVSSFSYFKNKTDTLNADPESAHFDYVRVRFNPKASFAMNDSLNNLTAQSFPDESMIVKEIYNQKGGPLRNYAIMYKLRNAANNGSGWIWAEIKPDGEVIYSASKKGDQCVACHASGNAVDLVRTFGLH